MIARLHFSARTILFALLLATPFAACDDGKKGIKRIEPSFGNVAGGDTVVLHGKGFKPGLSVKFGKRKARNVVIESDTKIRVKTPSGPEGKVDVFVTNQSGEVTKLSGAFTYRRGSR
jgi:hypothetical protein